MSKVNLKDIAKAMNVSVSTVSKALRDSYDIGSETKKKVFETAKKMQYTPNPYASFLRNNRSRTIAIIVPELTNIYFVQVINAAEEVAKKNEYHLLIYVTFDNPANEKEILKHLQNGRADGIMMSMAMGSSDYSHIQEIVNMGIPVVFFDRVCYEIETTKVTTDDFASGFKATEHLIQQGCRDIAYLSLSNALSIDSKRKQGYLEALNKNTIRINEDRIIQCNNDEKYNYKKIQTLLSGKKRPDGIFSSVERLALTTYRVCQNLHLDMPEQLKLVSFSNTPVAEYLNPALTTVTQPSREMGIAAAEALIKNLLKKRRPQMNENIVINSTLIERESSINASVNLNRNGSTTNKRTVKS